MSTWLDKVCGAGGTDSAARKHVLQALATAQRSRAKVLIEAPSLSSSEKIIMAVNVERVGQDNFVISKPMLNGAVHPLATHEPLTMALQTPQGRVCGTTQVLGRAKIPSGGRSVLYGYRLQLPESLKADERRIEKRVPIGAGLAPKAELRGDDPEKTVHGIIFDISGGGLQMRSYNVRNKLAIGDVVHVSVELPGPVGRLSEPVRVAYLKPGKTSRLTIIGLAFLERNDCVAELARHLGVMRTRRLRRR